MLVFMKYSDIPILHILLSHHTHTHTQTHHTHMYARTCMHTHTYAHAHACTQCTTRKHTHTHTHRAHKYNYIHTYKKKSIDVHILTHTNVHVCEHVHENTLVTVLYHFTSDYNNVTKTYFTSWWACNKINMLLFLLHAVDVCLKTGLLRGVIGWLEPATNLITNITTSLQTYLNSLDSLVRLLGSSIMPSLMLSIEKQIHPSRYRTKLILPKTANV